MYPARLPSQFVLYIVRELSSSVVSRFHDQSYSSIFSAAIMPSSPSLLSPPKLEYRHVHHKFTDAEKLAFDAPETALAKASENSRLCRVVSE